MQILAPGVDSRRVGFKICFQNRVNLDFPRVPSALSVITADDKFRAHPSRADNIPFEGGTSFVYPGSGIEADTEQSAIAQVDKSITEQQGYFFRVQYLPLAKAVNFQTFKTTLRFYTFPAYQPQRQVFVGGRGR